MNRHARFTQVEIARIMRAAKAVGGVTVVLRPDGGFAVEPSNGATLGLPHEPLAKPADQRQLAKSGNFDL